jgi:hypothetical protein
MMLLPKIVDAQDGDPAEIFNTSAIFKHHRELMSQ